MAGIGVADGAKPEKLGYLGLGMMGFPMTRRLIDAGRVTNEQNVWSFLVVSGKAKESGLMPIVGFEDGRAPPHAPPEIQEGCWYPVIYSAFPVVWTPADAPPPVPLTRRRPPCTHADGRDDVMAEKARRQAAVQAAN